SPGGFPMPTSRPCPAKGISGSRHTGQRCWRSGRTLPLFGTAQCELFLNPRGFEGLRTGAVRDQADHLALAQHVGAEQGHLDLGPATPPVCRRMMDHDDAITNIDELLRLEAQVVEGV